MLSCKSFSTEKKNISKAVLSEVQAIYNVFEKIQNKPDSNLDKTTLLCESCKCFL